VCASNGDSQEVTGMNNLAFTWKRQGREAEAIVPTREDVYSYATVV
jgi:hypothetical protein